MSHELYKKFRAIDFSLTPEVYVKPEHIQTVLKEVNDGVCDYWMQIDIKSIDLSDRTNGTPLSVEMANAIINNDTITVTEKVNGNIKAQHELSIENLVQGFRLAMDEIPSGLDLDKIDYQVSDWIIQCALLGSIKYNSFSDEESEPFESELCV